MQPTMPTDPSTPTLHGLTLAQLEAIRGYSATVDAIAAMLPDSAALGADSSMFEIGRVKRTLLSIAASVEAVGPYADGVRFSVASPPVAKDLATVRENVARAILARRTASGEGGAS